MAKHSLSLEIPEVSNTCILKIMDTSIYNTLSEPECLLLEVTVPGFAYCIQFIQPTIEKGFNINITACDLDLQVDNCGTDYYALPDGIYIIKYSVSPNDFVYVEYNHLRISKALKKYYDLLCQLDTCDILNDKINDKIGKLQKVKMYLDAAKAKVEVCHNPSEGMELYNSAINIMDKLTCKNC